MSIEMSSAILCITRLPFVSYGVGLGDERMLKFPAKTKMTMESINKQEYNSLW